jgi:hypothetical protein
MHASPDEHEAADPSGQGVFVLQLKVASIKSFAQTLTGEEAGGTSN